MHYATINGIESRIAEHLDAAIGDLSGRVVSGYWPFRGEPDLREWLERLALRGGRYALPVVIEKHAPLIFRTWRRGEKLEPGVWNILVPVSGEEVCPDFVIAPIVGYDRDGYRLGYGGGITTGSAANSMLRWHGRAPDEARMASNEAKAGVTGHRHGTVVRVRLDRKATSISLLVVLGVRADGQKVLLAIRSMGGESAEAWRTVLGDLVKRGLRRPEFLIVDGAPGLDKAIAAVWDGVPVQRCTVHKHRNLLAHAPERLHEEITADYNDMIYATAPEEIAARRKAFIRKWRLKHRAVADSLEEAGDRLFTFARMPPSQWRSLRTTNAIERLHEEFKRRTKTQTVLPSAATAAMMFWALLASGQISMRKVDGWQTLSTKPIDQPIDLAA